MLQKEEVSDVKWFKLKEIDDLIENGKFFRHNIDEYNYFLEYRK